MPPRHRPSAVFILATITLTSAAWIAVGTTRQPEQGGASGGATGTDPMKADGLKDFLTNLGYEPKATAANVFQITVERESLTYGINVQFSADTSVMWLTAYLRELPPTEKIPSAKVLAVLAQNARIQPRHFFVSSDGETPRWLFIGRGLDNRGITPTIVRRELDGLVTTIRETSAIWDTSTWTTEGAPAPSKEKPSEKPPK